MQDRGAAPASRLVGNDLMRGGKDADAMHGSGGNDITNGDSGGDVLYGGDGSDVIWGGRGNPDADKANGRGVNDEFVDYIFGGYGLTGLAGRGLHTGGADILDYAPRPTMPGEEAWTEMTQPYRDGQGEIEAGLPQIHQGVDLVYGGWDRDVMQSDIYVAEAGLPGDRLLDWYARYNLFTHCGTSSKSAVGEDRPRPGEQAGKVNSALITFLKTVAYATGVGDSPSFIGPAGSPAARELALVEEDDKEANVDTSPFPDPGSFQHKTCPGP